MYGGSDTSALMRQQQREQEANLAAASSNIEGAFAGFNPEFYKRRENAYLGYALPYLQKEYQDTRKNLIYRLANQGLLRSSAAGTLGGSLIRETSEKKRQLADEAVNQANALRQEIEQSKSGLLSQAMAGMSPSMASQQALAQSYNFRTPNPFAPVGGLLRDWSNIYLTKQIADVYGGADKEYPGYTWTQKGSSRQVGS